MPNTIQFKRGALSGLPSLAAGEPGFTTDQFRLYVGSAGGNRLVGLLHNNAATTAPTVNDDAGGGYSVGSRWIDVTADKSYVCVDSIVGAAVWQQTSGTGSGGITHLTGDAIAGPGSGSQVATIAADAVTNAKLANMAPARIKGRATSGTGDPEDLTGTQVTALLDTFTSSLKGLVPASGGGTTNFLRADGAFAAPPSSGVPRGHIDGLTLTYNSTTLLSIAAGQCADSTGARLLSLSAFTKTLQASGSWTAGSGNNGLDTGARAASTWYHVFVISDSTGATVDVLFSLSATAPTMPSGYTLFRRVGSFYTTASALFSDWWKQFGDTFLWSPRWDDVSALNPGTFAVTRTLTVPTGVRVCAIVGVGFDASTPADNAAAVLLSSLDTTDTAPSVSAYTYIAFSSAVLISNAGGQAQIWTNTSGQIRSRLQVSATNTRLRIHTYGWIDRRGRDA